MKTLFGRFAAAAFVSLASLAALADVPGRVGRVTHVAGPVSYYQDQDAGWSEARVNFHVTDGTSLFTDQGARAEFRIGGTAVRLDSLTQIDVQRLDDYSLAMYIPRGLVQVTVRFYDRRDSYTITTPDGEVVLRRDGRYRIEVIPDRAQTVVSALAGSARVSSGAGTFTLDRGKSVTLATYSGRPDATFDAAYPIPFDDWVAERDDRWGRAPQYVSSYMTGYEDLDTYGRWETHTEYGPVWYPVTVVAGWAPYRYGHWTYLRRWGWTWVDDAPWGYAPFHYGRWAYVGGRWGWCPGTYVQRPVWAPALVGFYGGSQWNNGAIAPGRPLAPLVGWFPLSPRDRYVPTYTQNVTYIRQVNNFTIINNNQTVNINHPNRDNGSTTVLRDIMVSSAPVAANVARVPGEAVRAAPLLPAITEAPRRVALAKPINVNGERAPGSNVQPGQPVQPAPAAAQPTQPTQPNAPRIGGETIRPPAVAAPSVAPAQPVPAQPLPAQPSRAVGETARPTAPGVGGAKPMPERIEPVRAPGETARPPIVATPAPAMTPVPPTPAQPVPAPQNPPRVMGSGVAQPPSPATQIAPAPMPPQPPRVSGNAVRPVPPTPPAPAMAAPMPAPPPMPLAQGHNTAPAAKPRIAEADVRMPHAAPAAPMPPAPMPQAQPHQPRVQAPEPPRGKPLRDVQPGQLRQQQNRD